MSLDLMDYFDIAMDIAMITSAYIIYVVAKGINFRVAVLNDETTEINNKLMETVKARDISTLNALQTSLELLKGHIDRVDLLINSFQSNTLEEQFKIAEIQSTVIKNQTEILNNQTEFFKRLKELYDQRQDLVENKNIQT